MSRSLHHKKRQIAVSSHFPQPTYRYVVQGALPLEAGKSSLYGLPLRVQGLPGHGVLPDATPSHQRFVGTIHLDECLCPVLATDQVKQWLTRVALVCNNEAGIAPCGVAGLREYVGCTFGIVDIACAHVGSYGQLGLGIYQEMELPTISELRVKAGKLEAHRVGREVLIEKAEVERLRR